MLRRQTYLATAQTAPQKTWRVVDADSVPLGRLAAEVSQYLMGKHRPEYTPHVDCGDYVVVTNASKVGLTGNKADQNMRMTYSGYPGGTKAETYGHLRERRPELLVEDAIRRMMPKNRLSRHMLKKLKIYAGSEHPHHAHKPVELKI